MKQPALLALACSAFVLYLAVSTVAAGLWLDGWGTVTLAVALWSTLVPMWFRRGQPDMAPPWVGRLACAVGLSLAAQWASSAHSLLGELVLAGALSAMGFMALKLALRVPDLPPKLARHQGTEPLLRLLSLLVAAAGVVAALPPLVLFERALIAPPWLAYSPLAYALACFALAFSLRVFRRALGSDARALSANIWGTFGLGAGVALAALALLLSWTQLVGLRQAQAGVAAGAMVVVLGHLWLVSPARIRVASRWLRELFAAVVGLAAALFAWVAFAPSLSSPLLGGLAFVGGLALFELVRRAVRRVSRSLLRPHGGNLLEAASAARASALSSRDFSDLCERLLRPLRQAALAPEAAPLLFVFDPVREVRLDAAGFARIEPRPLPKAIFDKLSEGRGAALIRDDIAGRLPRRPELRELLSAIDAHEALCVVPLTTEGELEGALLVARGSRREPVAWEELLALEELVRFVTPLMATFLTVERANVRFAEADRDRRNLAERVLELTGELARLRLREKVLSTAQSQFAAHRAPVCYGAAMRQLVGHLQQVASHDVPVLLLGEPGVPMEGLAELLHREGGRKDAPFVVACPVDIAPADQLVQLLGTEGHEEGPAGWLRLAAGGTLLLHDLAALTVEAQKALLSALSERRVRCADSAASYPLTARIVATSRRPLAEAVERGVVSPELSRWFETTSYVVPALRERPEDLESLVLLSVDRAARALGREVPGATQEAMVALTEYDWPGNLPELESVVARAVAAAQGSRIELSDLPALPRGAATGGSFHAQEREILQRALERAGGNRTRAARVLGLKRATLIDKLRRHGLDAQAAPRGARH